MSRVAAVVKDAVRSALRSNSTPLTIQNGLQSSEGFGRHSHPVDAFDSGLQKSGEEVNSAISSRIVNPGRQKQNLTPITISPDDEAQSTTSRSKKPHSANLPHKLPKLIFRRHLPSSFTSKKRSNSMWAQKRCPLIGCETTAFGDMETLFKHTDSTHELDMTYLTRPQRDYRQTQ